MRPNFFPVVERENIIRPSLAAQNSMGSAGLALDSPPNPNERTKHLLGFF
jgi:hypothetical protein